MPTFNPKTPYVVVPEATNIEDFHKYADAYVTRPPYQRKTVWSRGRQQSLLDSLFRKYYVPRIVLREIRLGEDRSVKEVVDGQQRISTVQAFYADNLPLPTSLEDVHSDLAGRRYSELAVEFRRFVDRLKFDVDVVIGIDDPRDPDHQRIATEIFWRLQQGESLNYMEVAHARLASLARNFVVKYADDQRFDYERYRPVDNNPDKHVFFDVIARKNERMQHLALLTRFLILEEAGGPADIKDAEITEYVERYQRPDGIGNLSMEDSGMAKDVLRNMRAFHEAFKDDPLVREGNGMKEFNVEYFIISSYLLLRHLRAYYVWGDAERSLFADFVRAFYDRWRGARRDSDADVVLFSDHRQQSANEIELRDQVIRQLFFVFAHDRKLEMKTLDERRAFSEAERIAVYRRDDGLCQMCLNEGKSAKEAFVRWDQYQTDHVLPHSRGGSTDVENAQVLCRYHNHAKGARIPEQPM